MKRIQFQHLPNLAIESENNEHNKIQRADFAERCPDGRKYNGECVSYEGGIKVEPNGLTRVTRWNRGSKGPLHDTLFETPHGAVKMTRPQIRPYNGRRRMDEEFVYVTFKFPKKYGLALTKALYEEEADEIMSYFKTRKEETVWK